MRQLINKSCVLRNINIKESNEMKIKLIGDKNGYSKWSRGRQNKMLESWI